MGRHREFIGNQYFTYTKKTAACKLDGCEYTYAPKSGTGLHAKPLIDHLKRKHLEEYNMAIDEAQEKQAKKRKLEESGHITNFFSTVGESSSSSKTPKLHNVEINVSKEDIQDLAVEAVTVNGLPLSVFEKSGISKMIAPIICKLGISLNRKAVRSLTMKAAQEKMIDLRAEFSQRMVCVKTDLCTRRGRHFIGVNFQAVVNGNLRVITATVKEMTERATGREIHAMLLSSLQKLGIEEQQIYTLTTDNGSNVVKAAKIMRENTKQTPEDTEESYGSDEYDDEVDNLSEEEISRVSELNETLSGIKTATEGVIPVRCAVHTLQLSVHDVISSNTQIKRVLGAVRKVVNKTHTQNMRLIFKQNRKALPKLDCDTRWGSTYDMLESVVAGKSFLDQIALANESLLLLENEWEIIMDLLHSLKPIYETTKTLQLRNLVAGQFLGEWMKCKVLLSKEATVTSLAVLQAMEKREEALLNNGALLSAVYLDPRFQCLLRQPQKIVAQQHLYELWKRMLMLETEKETIKSKEMEETDNKEHCLREDESTTMDVIDQLLIASDKNNEECGERDRTDMDGIRQAVNNFDNCKRVDRNEDIFRWWQCHPHQDLKRLAEVALALPVSQVSVERTFSGLRYIPDELRLGLKEDIIESIMFLRCNT